MDKTYAQTFWDLFTNAEQQDMISDFKQTKSRKPAYRPTSFEYDNIHGKMQNDKAASHYRDMQDKYKEPTDNTPIAFKLITGGGRMPALSVIKKLAQKYLTKEVAQYVDEYLSDTKMSDNEHTIAFKTMFVNALPEIFNPKLELNTPREFLNNKYKDHGGLDNILAKKSTLNKLSENDIHKSSTAFKKAYAAMHPPNELSAYGETAGNTLLDIYRMATGVKHKRKPIDFYDPKGKRQTKKYDKMTRNNLDIPVSLIPFKDSRKGVAGHYKPLEHAIGIDNLHGGQKNVYNHEMSHAVQYSLPHQIQLKSQYNLNDPDAVEFNPEEIEASLMEGHSEWMEKHGGRPILRREDADEYYNWLQKSDFLKQHGYRKGIKKFLDSDPQNAKIFLQSIVKNNTKKGENYG